MRRTCGFNFALSIENQLSQLMRLWYLSHRRPAKAQATSEGSGEPARPRSLIRAFAIRTHNVWKKTKCLTKYQTCSPNGLLRMRVWRLSLRRAIIAIISWVGSIMNHIDGEWPDRPIHDDNRPSPENANLVTCRIWAFNLPSLRKNY